MANNDNHTEEFDCIECGRHIIVICGFHRGVQLCAVCMSLPGWFHDPKLRDIFARGEELILPVHERDTTP